LWGFDFTRLCGLISIGINNAVHLLNPTVLIFNDVVIWERYLKVELPEDSFCVTQRVSAKWLAANPECSYRDRVLSYKQRGPDVQFGDDELWVDHTTATAAIQLAWKMGAERVFLLGVDAYRYESAVHCTDPIVATEPQFSEPRHIAYAMDMNRLQDWFKQSGLGPPGGVFNCSELSIIDAFEYVDIDAIIPPLEQ